MQNIQQTDTVIGNHQFTSTLSTSQGSESITGSKTSSSDGNLGFVFLAILLVLFLIWFSILNIGLQKIGVSIPKVIVKFIRDIGRSFKSRKAEAEL